MTRTVLNGRGKPVVLTPENCTCDGWAWRLKALSCGWDDMDWSAAVYRAVGTDVQDRHLHVPHGPTGTAHRLRGLRWTITGLVEE